MNVTYFNREYFYQQNCTNYNKIKQVNILKGDQYM